MAEREIDTKSIAMALLLKGKNGGENNEFILGCVASDEDSEEEYPIIKLGGILFEARGTNLYINGGGMVYRDSSEQITVPLAPTNNTDAVSKKYVDDLIGDVDTTLTNLNTGNGVN